MPNDVDPFGNLEAWKKCATTLRDMFQFTEKLQQQRDLPMPLRIAANSATIELMKMNVFIQEELLKRQPRLVGNVPAKLETDISSPRTKTEKNIT